MTLGGFVPILKRELFAFFVTPLAWVLVTAFLVAQGMHFMLLVSHFSGSPEIASDQTPVSAFFGNTVILYLVLFLLVPPVTMRLFAEERRSGTIESLMTAPVASSAVVLAKYVSALIAYVAMWAPTALYLVILSRTGEVDWHVALSSYAGVTLVGATYLALGLLMSALTKSQFLALVMTALVVLVLFILGVGEFVAREGTLLHDVCAFVSVWAHMNDFASGVIDTRRLVYYGGVIVAALFVTVRVVDAWRWGAVGRARLLSALPVALVVTISVLANLVAARHFRRWDVTMTQRYTLSSATTDTLSSLPATVNVWVLLGPGDPLGQSVRQIIPAYQAASTKIDVKYIDPDRDPLAFEDARRRFRVEAGRAADGRVVTDAALIVFSGDRHWFLTVSDLVEVSDPKEGRARPKEEQALTLAIRSVIAGEKATLCFTTGHGEMALDDGTERGIAHLRDVVEKDNFTTVSIDTTSADPEPYKRCAAVVVAGMKSAFSKEESNRLRTYALTGGSLLVAVSPIAGPGVSGLEAPGLEDVLGPFGIGTEDALVFEGDDARSLEDRGAAFFVEARPHAVTAGLLTEKSQSMVPRLKVRSARPLRKVQTETSAPAFDLLVTSDKSYAKKRLPRAADTQGALPETPGDIHGPLVLALASERPKTAPSQTHGPRVVVVGSQSVLSAWGWREPTRDRGAALFVESALTWLTSRPPIVDVPARATVPAGVRVTEESRREIRNYVLFLMPAAAALLGVVIALRRRSTEGAPRTPRRDKTGRKPAAKGR